ncbi:MULTISPECIES: sensor domain-containing diguanylate cyclase [Pseudoalteromonas]|uniref:sensor domain-containing diguanylate cyclase n=1 Tax=Pseudoalteromonas TaxID=53246 RepID=UPI00030A06C0|nr:MULTISPECIES: diguanylate cyclase [Pseudoalteromonas]MDP4487154.1 diguanylate cyclase [Pseudoalteromonas piscicida]
MDTFAKVELTQDLVESSFPLADLNTLLTSLSDYFEVPITLVTVIEGQWQHLIARHGILADKTPEQDAFCKSLIKHNKSLLVPDTAMDENYANNPLVTGEPYIRSYLGVPFRLDGKPIGGVCLIDTKPKTYAERDVHLLETISGLITNILELQKNYSLYLEDQELIRFSPIVLIKWKYNNGLRIRTVSPNIERVIGIDAFHLCSGELHFEDLLTEPSVEKFHFNLQNHLDGLEASEILLEMALDSKQIWIRMITVAHFNHDGRMTSIQAFITENTAQKYTEDKLNETNRQMRLLLEASELGTWDWNIPADINKVNKKWCDMLGIEFEYVETSVNYFRQLIHPADRSHVERDLAKHLQGLTDAYTTSYRMKHADGHWVWIETYGKVVERDNSGRALRLAGTHRDITYRMEAQLQERKQKQLLSFISKAQSAYLKTGDLSKSCREILEELIDIADSQFALIGELEHTAGVPRLFIHAISEMQWNDLSSQLVQRYYDNDLYFTDFNNLFGSVILTGKTVISNERGKHPASKGTPKGHPRISKFLGLPIKLNGELVGMIGLANKFFDYTEEDAKFLQPLVDSLAGLYYAVKLDKERQEAENKLLELAMTDTLSGLPNRRAFMEKAAEVGEISFPYLIGMVDIDNFKSINDTYGHDAGDKAIKLIAYTIKDALRSDDFTARMGGEEFAFVLLDATHGSSSALIETIRESISNLEITLSEEEKIHLTVSIGVKAVLPEMEKMSITGHLNDADKALYEAKHTGKNKVVWFE